MGVDVTFYQVIGLKGPYSRFKSYTSKVDPFYISDMKDGSTDDYMHIIFEDYLPENFKVISDGMCGQYSIIGKVIQKKDYIDEINDNSYTIQQLQQDFDKVLIELIALGIYCEKEDIELITFCHFS